MKISFLSCTVLFLLIPMNTVLAQEEAFDFERIEDNSFLIEEAYNQEPGVIQHISAFQYMKDKTWAYSFTEEWPVPSQRHQISFTLPVMKNSNTGLGDIALNYRFQAIFTKRLAFSPRASLLFPTGEYKKGLGNGVLGYQVNIPLSFICSQKIVTHYNLGTTFIPQAKSADNVLSDITNINYGVSAIVLLTETLNFMVEAAGNTSHTKVNSGETETTNDFFINPGIRFAINCKSGLQVVPGLAAPIGIGPSAGDYGIFLYLSFEHGLWKP